MRREMSEALKFLFFSRGRGDETLMPGRVNVPPTEKDADRLPPDDVLHLPGGGQSQAGRALHHRPVVAVEPLDSPL